MVTRIVTAAEIKKEINKSSKLSPSIFPNNIWSKCTSVDTLEYKTMPKPNIPEKTTPIIVSCLILLFSLKNPDATAQIIPEQKAPISKGICNKYDIIIPGSTEWLIASPISDQPFSTK